MDGLTAIAELHAAERDVRVVVLGVREIAEEVIAWAEAGVAGYVSHESPLTELVGAVQRAAGFPVRRALNLRRS